MDPAEFEVYVDNRYREQIQWYDAKAEFNQWRYRFYQSAILVLSALTPILIGIDFVYVHSRWLAIGVSFLVTLFVAIITTFKYHENWINYRTTSETLKKEVHYYTAKLYGYDSADDPEAYFVERVENLISRENTLWLTAYTRFELKDK